MPYAVLQPGVRALVGGGSLRRRAIVGGRTAKTAPVALLLTLTVAVSGCGTSGSGADGQGATRASTGAPASPTDSVGSASSSNVRSSLFPLTILRSGGIAGFQDSVLVESDGAVTTRTRSAVPRHCKLTTVALDALRGAVEQVPWGQLKPPRTASPTIADELVVTVESAAGGPARTTDPDLQEISGLASDLLADVLGARPAYRLCPSTD